MEILNQFIEWYFKNNLTGSYDPNVNAKYCISEMIELARIGDKSETEISHEDLAEKIVKECQTDSNNKLNSLDEAIAAIDANLDNIIYGFNFIVRILTTHFDVKDPKEAEDIIKKLLIIIHASAESKTGGKNADGKYEKGNTFIPPEPAMKNLLSHKFIKEKKHEN